MGPKPTAGIFHNVNIIPHMSDASKAKETPGESNVSASQENFEKLLTETKIKPIKMIRIAIPEESDKTSPKKINENSTAKTRVVFVTGIITPKVPTFNALTSVR